MKAYFITSSGTDLGKTLVTAALCHQLRAAGRRVLALKPVASGFDPKAIKTTDTGILIEALGLKETAETIERISPWRFSAALSPDMAARREGRQIDFAGLLAYCRSFTDRDCEILLIEGIGGALVPLTGTATSADWMAELGLPAIVVVGSYLGSLSHTLATVTAMEARRIPIAAVVVSESADSPVPLAETAETLRRFLPQLPLIPLPRLLQDPSPWRSATDLGPLLPIVEG
jgi:dethiobiotin synthetase